MPTLEPPRPPADADLGEVELLLRLARRWRHLGSRPGEPGQEGGRHLSPHLERGLLALARLGRAERRGVRISHLAQHLGIAPRSATEVADALESVGLATRSPDPTDRRAVLLNLTDEGRQAVAVVRDRRRAAAGQALETLTPEDRAELRRILLQLLSEQP